MVSPLMNRKPHYAWVNQCGNLIMYGRVLGTPDGEIQMSIDRIESVLQDWLRDGRSKLDDLVDITKDQWDELIEGKLEEAEEDIKEFPEKAFAKIMSFINFMESAAKILPHLAEVLSSYIIRIKKILDAVCKSLGAKSYSISVGAPTIST